MTEINRFQSVAPPHPGEAAAADASWERRGPLGRLVRIAEEVPASEHQLAAHRPRHAGIPVTRSAA